MAKCMKRKNMRKSFQFLQSKHGKIAYFLASVLLLSNSVEGMEIYRSDGKKKVSRHFDFR